MAWQEGSYGPQMILTLDCGQDISGATTARMYYTKPSGTSGYWDASVGGDDNEDMTYAIQSGDLDEAGTWTFMSYVEMTGYTGYGEKVRYNVGARIVAA